ncbi:MAG TPA: hypothetical protein VGK24_20300 [Candidatus Angelobacter sp.]
MEICRTFTTSSGGELIDKLRRATGECWPLQHWCPEAGAFGGTGADSWQPEAIGTMAVVNPDGSPIVHEACNNSAIIAIDAATLPANRTIVPMPMCLKATPDFTAGGAH